MIYASLVSLIFLPSVVCAADTENVLRVGLAQAPLTLDPRFASDAASERMCHLIYRKLVDFNERYEPVPQLADWEMLAPTHYRFTLRQEGRDFHDGSTLTAADVKATYDSVLDAQTASPHRGSLTIIDHIEVIDANRIDFHLQHADPLFPGRLTLGILAAHAVSSAQPTSTPIGSGPFRFESWPDPTRLRLQRTADGRRVQFEVVPNPTVRALKLVRGEIDMLQGDMPPELLVWLSQQDSLHAERTAGDGVAYLGFNMQDPLISQWPVRAAIAHAIDRDAIIRFLFRGRAQAVESILLPMHWAGAVGLQSPGYAPEKSRELLAKLGYGATHPLRLVYKTSSDPFRVRLATIIQSQLREVGIDVSLRSNDFATFYSDIKVGRFQMYSMSWVGLKLPDIFHYAFHSESIPPAGANRGRLHDAELDALIDFADAQTVPESQANAYQAVQARILQQLPMLPLWSEDVTVVSRAKLRHFVPSADGSYDKLAQADW
ncbi:MAG: ABC transporter substrate-binding protein [Gammaproteobacteria bacterium]